MSAHSDSFDSSLKVSILGTIICLLSIFFCNKSYLISRLVDKIPVESEVKMGELMFRASQKEFGITNNIAAHQELTKLASEISNHIEDTQYKYKVFLSKNSSINAFALPGGYIVINKGLIDNIKSTNELYAVIAHEIAHIEHRHSAKQLIHSISNYSLFFLLLGGIDNIFLTMAGKGSFLLNLQYSRHNESAADKSAIQYLAKANISPHGLISFFKTLQEKEQSESYSILSTHPTNARRIRKIETLINQLGRNKTYKAPPSLEQLQSIIEFNSDSFHSTTLELAL